MSLHLSKSLLYAVHCLHYLTTEGAGRPVMVREICDRYGFPYDSVLRTMRQLRNARILTGQRGLKGGFSLHTPATRVNLLHVIEIVDGPFEITDPLPPGKGSRRLRKAVAGRMRGANERCRNELAGVDLPGLLRAGEKG